jgi:uncharacterized protein
MTPDVNVLLAAARQEHVHHALALNWLLQMQDGKSPKAALRLLPVVMAGFLRLVTNGRVFAQPTPPDQAMDFLDDLIDMPGAAISENASSWPIFRHLCLSQALVANAIPDALIAAAVIQSKDVLVTFDRDFLRLLPPTSLILLKP